MRVYYIGRFIEVGDEYKDFKFALIDSKSIYKEIEVLFENYAYKLFKVISDDADSYRRDSLIVRKPIIENRWEYQPRNHYFFFQVLVHVTHRDSVIKFTKF